MYKLAQFILLVSAFSYGAPSFYVVGENYVAFSKAGQELLITRDIQPTSWTLDKKQCRLWVSSKDDSNLLAFENGKKSIGNKLSGKIVSKVFESQFVTVTDNHLMQFRDLNGQVKFQVPFEHSVDLQRIILLPEGGSWNLFEGKSGGKRDSLWLSLTDGSGNELKKISIESSQHLWGRTIFALDQIRQRLWVGYTRSTPQHMYSPYVVQFSSEGQKEFSYQWKDRGILFDGCLESNGDLLVSRDIPSPEFTVPVYSFLESLEWGSTPSIRLNLDSNLLVDSIDCKSDSIYLGVHSILGGEPHQVLYWDREPKSAAETIVVVPPKIQEFLACD